MQQKKQYFLRLAVIIGFNLCVVAMVWMAFQRVPAQQTLSRVGSQGDEVYQIQERLAGLGYDPGSVDGKYGDKTAEAVLQFQQDNGLGADGVAGPDTLAALGIGGQSGSNNESASGNSGQAAGPVSGVYREGDSGDEVRQIQQVLADVGYYTGAVDGQFGSGTTHAVKAFQRNKGIGADGVVGAATLRALGISSAGGSYSDSEVQLLARMVSAESRGEPYSGQVAVAAVILNRVGHPSFPDTLSGVLYQPGAFSSVNDGQFNEPVTDSALRAAREALNGSDPSGGAIYFYNPNKTNNQWIRERPVIVTIGGHIFCA